MVCADNIGKSMTVMDVTKAVSALNCYSMIISAVSVQLKCQARDEINLKEGRLVTTTTTTTRNITTSFMSDKINGPYPSSEFPLRLAMCTTMRRHIFELDQTLTPILLIVQ